MAIRIDIAVATPVVPHGQLIASLYATNARLGSKPLTIDTEWCRSISITNVAATRVELRSVCGIKSSERQNKVPRPTEVLSQVNPKVDTLTKEVSKWNSVIAMRQQHVTEAALGRARAMQKLVDEVGATNAAKALGVSRQAVYACLKNKVAA